MRLKDRVALVTGAGGPMGRAVAERFAAEGAALVLTDISGSRLEETVAQLRNSGVSQNRLVSARADVAVKDEAQAVAEAGIKALGRIDILANIVGGIRDTKLYQPLLDMSEERWDATFDINLKGNIHLVQRIVPGMIERKYGKVLNISSINFAGEAGNADYGAAKAAVASLTRTMAIEFAPHINVNCLVPGAIETRAMLKLGEAEKEGYRTRNLMRRLGQPSDIANAALFLCSDEASFITGHLLPVSGGLWPSL